MLRSTLIALFSAVLLLCIPAVAFSEEAKEELLAKARAAAVERLRSEIDAISQSPAKPAKGQPRKAFLIAKKAAEKRLKELKDKLAAIEAGGEIPFDPIDLFAMKVGMSGSLRSVRYIEISQIIDDETMLVFPVTTGMRLTPNGLKLEQSSYDREGDVFMLKGLPTKDFADGQQLEKLGGVFFVAGTERYDTADGSTNTVFVVKLIKD